MADKKETKPELEREYIIPLREKCRSVPTYAKANKAVKTIKQFLVRHMKIRDRDLDKVLVDRFLNEFIWSRGIKHPPIKVKVKAVKINGIVKVELVDIPHKLAAKRTREEKREINAMESGKKEKKTEEKKVESTQALPESKAADEKKVEEKEKKASLVEAGEKMEKAQGKSMKHMVKKQEVVSSAQKKSLQR